MLALLHELLEESARRRPRTVAFSLDQNHLTYDELDRAANRLAQLLCQNGVLPGDRVGVHLDKSLAAVSAVYGILKTGAAYVPLDPAAPASRNAKIIADCGLKALVGPLSGPGARSTADPGAEQRNLLRIDPDLNASPPEQKERVFTGKDLDEQIGTPPDIPRPDPDALACILYTSGSTGTPKGVMISHRAAMTFVKWAEHSFRLMEDDRIAAQAPLIFDLSIFDLFAGVRAGASAVLLPRAVAAFPMNLSSFIETREITRWYTVPSSLTRVLLAGALEKRNFSRLKTILFAGEVFPVKYLRRLMSSLPGTRFYNLFGPTETNVCTYYPVDELPASDESALPIGRACADSEIHLLNAQQEPVEPGAIGEMYVRGPAVMRGYWNRPEGNRAALIELPDGQGPAYRTGDFARQDEDGLYHFQGRGDFMIKRRGYRIEPGEVEAALDAHPAVQQSVVVAGEDQAGDELRAILVELQPVSDTELLQHCSGLLPAYMLPTQFERRADLPRTATGKIDRAALRVGKQTAVPVGSPAGETV